MDAARQRYQQRIPAHYTWWLHIAIDVSLAGGTIAFALSRLRPLAGHELLAVPIAFLAANVAEYFLHRYPMHRPIPPRYVYERHAVIHHSYFTDASMGLESMRDLRWVLFPAFTVPLLVVAMLPIASAVGALVSPNAGWLTLAVTAAYYVLYEFLHTAYHLPPESFLGRLAPIRYLRRLHRDHHNPLLMDRYNFNVTFPICDAIFSTWWPPMASRRDTREETEQGAVAREG